jgi:N-acetylglutamate synthase-like GNAT family acetyltransferase
MSPSYRLVPITGLDVRLVRLREEAAREGFRLVTRLIDDWASRSNTFDQPGERLIGAVRAGELLGFCGLNRDPFVAQSDVGRLRHLYVTKAERRSGIGTALVLHLLHDARGAFRIVRLRTGTVEATLFYEGLGFRRTQEDSATHVWTC